MCLFERDGRLGVLRSGSGCHVQNPSLEAPPPFGGVGCRCCRAPFLKRQGRLTLPKLACRHSLLLKVDGVGVFERLLYVGDGGLLARVQHVEWSWRTGAGRWRLWHCHCWLVAVVALCTRRRCKSRTLWREHHLALPSLTPITGVHS